MGATSTTGLLAVPEVRPPGLHLGLSPQGVIVMSSVLLKLPPGSVLE
jgi:hypothetical protein